MRGRDTENALDAILIPNCDLDVVLHAKGRTIVEWRPFDKYALDCVERGLGFFGPQMVKVVQDGAVQIVSEAIRLISW